MKQLYPPQTPSKTCETPSNNGKNKKQITTTEEDTNILFRRKGAINCSEYSSTPNPETTVRNLEKPKSHLNKPLAIKVC